jgi:curli biogenesis system outer membrane secretion channel CsgG
MTQAVLAKFARTASTAVLAGALAAMSAYPALAQTTARPAAAYGALQGPKKSVAVVDFGAHGAFQSQYGSWDAGGGLAAMLETELSQTGRFHMAGRSHLDSVLYEQKLGALGLTGAAETAKAGALTGAQFLIRASVTDFTLAEKGGGFSIGGTAGGVLGAISPQMREGRVSIDFQVVDSTSGQVVDAFSVTRKVKSRSIAVTATKSGVSVGGNRFANTPLGQAAREAIAEAAARIVSSLEDETWSARVAQIQGGALYVNTGADAGLRVGDTLRIQRVVQTIKDPVSGALLGVEQVQIGEAVISSVADRYATASFRSAHEPAIGDVLTLAHR